MMHYNRFQGWMAPGSKQSHRTQMPLDGAALDQIQSKANKFWVMQINKAMPQSQTRSTRCLATEYIPVYMPFFS